MANSAAAAAAGVFVLSRKLFVYLRSRSITNICRIFFSTTAVVIHDLSLVHVRQNFLPSFPDCKAVFINLMSPALVIVIMTIVVSVALTETSAPWLCT